MSCHLLDNVQNMVEPAREVTADKIIIIIIIIKVKCSRYRPCVAQRVGRGIALLFHDRGTRRG